MESVCAIFSQNGLSNGDVLIAGTPLSFPVMVLIFTVISIPPFPLWDLPGSGSVPAWLCGAGSLAPMASILPRTAGYVNRSFLRLCEDVTEAHIKEGTSGVCQDGKSLKIEILRISGCWKKKDRELIKI
jgi:hypothetical protein